MSLTGQDIAEAQGALASLLGEILAPHGISTTEFITMRVIVVRGKEMTLDQMKAFLVSQRQLGLNPEDADALFDGLRAKGWTAGGALTGDGHSVFERLNALVGTLTPRVFAGFDAYDLEVAHQVMRKVVVNAGALREELVSQACG
jgi:hypothetical protein